MKFWMPLLSMITLLSCGPSNPKENPQQKPSQEDYQKDTQESEVVEHHEKIEKPYFAGYWIEVNSKTEELTEINIDPNGTLFQSQGTIASAGTWEQLSEDHLRITLENQTETQNWFVSSNKDSSINISVQVPNGKSALLKRYRLLNR